MSELDNMSKSSILDRLRGIGKGGVSASVGQPQQQANPLTNQLQATEEKSKRDIKELYDFIDKYCSGEE